MSCDLKECWDDWGTSDVDPEFSVETPIASSNDYSKRFVPMSARRSNASVDDGGKDWWTMIQIMEEWKEEQSKMFRIYIVLSALMFLNLIVKIRHLERLLKAK